jgi:hypothetical protein
MLTEQCPKAPCSGQCEKNGASGGDAGHSGKQSEGKHRNRIFRGNEHMRDTIIKRAKTGRDKMCMRLWNVRGKENKSRCDGTRDVTTEPPHARSSVPPPPRMSLCRFRHLLTAPSTRTKAAIERTKS